MIIEVRNLTKHYKSNIVLNNISFVSHSGTITGLIGMNGSGKSTLIKILLGLIPFQSGELLFNATNRISEFRERIGYVPENGGISKEYTVFNYLNYFCILRGISKHRIEFALEQIGISYLKKTKIKKLSHGTQKKVLIAQAILSEPDLLILDEPTNGLDLQTINEIRAILKNYAAGNKTIIIASHNIIELERLCDQYLFLKGGNMISKQGLSGAVVSYSDLEEKFLRINT